jgi:hypothetical protein
MNENLNTWSTFFLSFLSFFVVDACSPLIQSDQSISQGCVGFLPWLNGGVVNLSCC